MRPRFLRPLLNAALDRSVVEHVLTRATTDAVTIFLCHRFDVDVPGQRSHSGALLVDVLEWLRRHRYPLVGIDDVVDAQRGRRSPLGRSVAFTLDDGYQDQADAAEVFARFDCPVSLFLTTGFLDGTVVPWWDQLAEILDRAPPTFDAEWPDGPVRVRQSESRRPALRALEERCKEWAPDVRDAAIASLAAAADSEVPARPRDDSVPMTWTRARALEQTGLVSFGPHTVAHPILRTLDDDAAAVEISASWRRLQDELAAPLPVFCYPNGRAVDFGERDEQLVRDAGCLGALTAEGGYAAAGPGNPYRVPRLLFPSRLDDVKRWVTGFEALSSRTKSSPIGANTRELSA